MSGAFAGQWLGGNGTIGEDNTSSSPTMSATSGPVDPFYWPGRDTPTAYPNDLAPPPQEASRSHSRSPVQQQLGPANHTLNNAKSTPVLLPSRPPGSVKNIANKFDQAGSAEQVGPQRHPQLTVRTSHDRYRRNIVGKSPRSPTKDGGVTKLQKKHPGLPRSLLKSPDTSFDTSSSFGSTSTVQSTKSQPHAAFSPAKPSQAPYLPARPLFGEITSDGKWNGNFDLGNYTQLPDFAQSDRRASDGNVALGHGRSQSHQDILQPASATALSAPKYQTLSHKRSRSEMDMNGPPQPPSMPNLNSQQLPAMYPTPPNSAPRHAMHKQAPTSRIPISNRRPSEGSASSSGTQSRSASALSHTARNRLSKSPTRKNQANPKENTTPGGLPRSRYQPPPITTEPNGQTLSAKIVAPLPKTSPPLRSSRPRQPVSSATTSASRARAAERFQSPTTKDGRRPSEQWLGKPYDAQQERSKRKIPELGKIDFEARRQRIQKAISQNLEETRSLESLRARSRSRQASQEQERQVDAGAEREAVIFEDQHQTEEMPGTPRRETDIMPGGWPTPGGLSVDTFNIPMQSEREPEPDTAHTEFEIDESPVLGRPPTREHEEEEPQPEQPIMLTSATYQRSPTRKPAPIQISPVPEAPMEEVQSPSVLENVMSMRQRGSSQASRSGTDYADDSAPPSAEDSPSDLEERWGLGTGLNSLAGSIKIMLDDVPSNSRRQERSWSRDVHAELDNIDGYRGTYEFQRQHQLNQHAHATNGYTHSPVDDLSAFSEQQRLATPRGDLDRENTLRPSDFQPRAAFVSSTEDMTDPAIARAIAEYQSNGTITPDMLQQMQRHVVDLQRMSANEGSNGFMIQSLLDSIMDVQKGQSDEEGEQSDHVLPSTTYEIPEVTPDTPPGWEYDGGSGIAVVFSNEPTDDRDAEQGAEAEQQQQQQKDDDADFHIAIRRADEAFERQQRGEYLEVELEDGDKPEPPPKDFGYTPRSSTGPNSATFPPQDFTHGLRISTAGQSDARSIQSAGDSFEPKPMEQQQTLVPNSAPPRPNYAPPPPPSGSSTRLPFGMGEMPQMPVTYSERGSSELSPKARRNIWDPSGSSRPSMDSQRTPAAQTLPGSVSMSSFTESTRQDSMDTGEIKSGKDTSPLPEQKRLLKRRHIIKELLDTENSYHQDLKIIEDIYKATAVPDLISPDDKKILFGNCDEIERFSLHFYDELRKAVASVYVPAKQRQWMNRRGSFSTTQSDGTTHTSAMTPEGANDEKDRITIVGQAFCTNLQAMEQVYTCYLKNHDAANQRLSALRNTATVKCWLDECHNNASDITSAWDLDSLLVKPTQRVAKYPMLLQQLLETTPQSHPDREALATAAADSISMLTRINDAKKRADLVDQIVNRKRKDSDVRTGIAKAFGRRTEKLKERVGIAEAFQDPEFDQLAHKFGGHYIRLQICMRDVQEYMTRMRKGMDQMTNYANALDLFTDVSMSSGSEVESRWRKYSQTIRELTNIAFADHQTGVQKRVIDPMVTCIGLHDGPQNAINNRKKRIVDYAKCKAIEKRGEKPDKKTIEASEMYVALNDQLKIELPKLYSLTASLVQSCLNCFLDIQLTWNNTWERKLRPMLEEKDIPANVEQIERAFRPDFDAVKDLALELGICNGAALADSANFLSPSFTIESEPSSAKRPSMPDSSKRTMSVGGEDSPIPGSAGYKRRSSSYAPGTDALNFLSDGRMRSNSSLSQRGTPSQTPGSVTPANRPWSNSNATSAPFGQGRPATANPQPSQPTVFLPPRTSAEHTHSPRPTSGATYFTARPELENSRFSGIFSSAMPSADAPDPTQPVTPRPMPEDTRVLFVCASLFEFSIDKTRREGGYPYLTYVQGEVFDVIAQKGELWLAKNQDDSTNTLGWIWEQHFVILSQD